MAGGPLGAAGSGREAGIREGRVGDLPDQVAAMDINVKISATVMVATVMVRIDRLKAMFHKIRDYPAGLRTSGRELRIGRQLRHGHRHHARE